MELRLKLYYAKMVRTPGTLVCSRCGAEKQLLLFEGNVCSDCWAGYDLEADSILYMEQIRVQVGAIIAGGMLRRDIAKAIGFSASRLGEFLNARCDSVDIADALERWMAKNKLAA